MVDVIIIRPHAASFVQQVLNGLPIVLQPKTKKIPTHYLLLILSKSALTPDLNRLIFPDVPSVFT